MAEPPRNLILIGFMGVGKSTVGRILAESLGWKLVDTDAVIAKVAGASVPKLFEREGEATFRARESQIVLGVCAGERQVISTGGGAPLREENGAALRGAGLVVWLTARPEVVAARTSRRAGQRPLLAGEEEPLTKILRLLSERGPIYQRLADHIVDTSDRSPKSASAEILRKMGAS